MDSDYSLCVLCCCSFGNEAVPGSTNRDDIVKFFKILVRCPPDFSNESCSNLVDELPSVLSSSGLSICSDCHAIVTVALETRARAENMEENVRKLQMKILEQLRALNSEMDLFHEEMTKIESVVKTSDESCLLFHMPNRESNGGTSCDNENNGVLLLRERILDVVTDLRMYQVSCNDPNKFRVVESDLEAMWEDAEQLVQCTPDISIDSYGQQLSNSNSSQDNNDYYYEDSTITNSESTPMLEEGTVYMGHSVGTDFYTENDSEHSDTEGNGFMIPSRYASSGFREEVVKRAIAREETRTVEMEKCSDPMRRYYLKYSKKLDQLQVGNVEVKVDPFLGILQCSQCSIVGKRMKSNQSRQHWRDMEKGILVHIIGKHLGGFKCSQCGEVFTSHTMIKKHYSKEHPGKTVASSVARKIVAQPVAPAPVPVTVPSKALPAPVANTARKSGKQFKCSMCTHSFSFKGQLKKHFIAKHTSGQPLPDPLAQPEPAQPPRPAIKRNGGGGGHTAVYKGKNDKPIPLKSATRPHECHICKYAFTKGSHLKRHFEVHRKRNEMD